MGEWDITTANSTIQHFFFLLPFPSLSFQPTIYFKMIRSSVIRRLPSLSLSPRLSPSSISTRPSSFSSSSFSSSHTRSPLLPLLLHSHTYSTMAAHKLCMIPGESPSTTNHQHPFIQCSLASPITSHHRVMSPSNALLPSSLFLSLSLSLD